MKNSDRPKHVPRSCCTSVPSDIGRRPRAPEIEEV
jgi:hypothetical protein